MINLPPSTQLALGVVLRELEQTIIPDLSSAHAQTVAGLAVQLLRNLHSREDRLKPLLENWRAENQHALIKANQDADGSNINDSNNDISGNAFTANAARLANIISEQIQRNDTVVRDDLCQTVIRAEQTFYRDHQQVLDNTALPINSSQTQQQLAVDKQKLETYLRKKLAASSLTVNTIEPILSGFSKQTFLIGLELDGEPHDLVMRRNIRYGAVNSSVVDEYPLIDALHRVGLAVPEPILLEPDTQAFGEAFTLTRRAPGQAAAHAMAGLKASPEQTQAALALAKFLAQLHCIEPETLDLDPHFYSTTMTTRDYMAKEIDICERYLDDHSQMPSPTLRAAIAWLRANLPDTDKPPRLVHGDASLSNIMMDNDRISVMLDWELAHLGEPAEDIIYARKWIDQVMPWQDFIDAYAANGGNEYLPERERFYSMLSDLRVAAFATRTQDLVHKSPQPEIAHLFSAQHYYGYFVSRVADHLLA